MGETRCGERKMSHVTVSKGDNDEASGKKREGHVSSSLPSLAIRHAALQSHSFLCKGEPGGTICSVRQSSSMVHICFCGDVDGLIWGI